MFERPHHRRIFKLLSAMNAGFLAEHHCCFAGGTCLALRLGEFRESVDMDFLCASVAGYRAVRSTVTNLSLGALFESPPRFLREVRADRYGVRTVLLTDEVPIKFEIVLEGRIELDCERVESLPVPIVNRAGLFAEKLLANCDRHADRSTFARDIVDLLVMMERWGEIPDEAWIRAESAYGDAPAADLRRAAKALRGDSGYLEECFDRLAVTPAAREIVRGRLQNF